MPCDSASGAVSFCFRFWCFFFSSRRRHTRWPRDWSSDVCSSDLPAALGKGVLGAQVVHMARGILIGLVALVVDDRSEERRVGKGGGSRQPTAAAGIEAPGRVVLSGGRMREKSKAGAVRTHQDEYV